MLAVTKMWILWCFNWKCKTVFEIISCGYFDCLLGCQVVTDFGLFLDVVCQARRWTKHEYKNILHDPCLGKWLRRHHILLKCRMYGFNTNGHLYQQKGTILHRWKWNIRSACPKIKHCKISSLHWFRHDINQYECSFGKFTNSCTVKWNINMIYFVWLTIV